jgi:AAA domain
MKLSKVTIEGFRGVPKQFDLKLNGKSLCLVGENGRGKSTIVDALEYWSTGGLDAFKSEGCQLDAAINLDHGPPATVICERQGHPMLRRSLTSARRSELETVGSGASAVSPPPRLPILRHSTMAGFMARSSGEKKRALLAILGLEDLLTFRDALETAAKTVSDRADQAERHAQDEAGKLDRECGGKQLLDRAEELRLEAGLPTPMTSADDLLQIKVATEPAVTSRVNRSQLVDSTLELSAKLGPAAIADWNKIVADRQVKEAEAAHELVEVGRRVLETWEPSTCPLCLQADDPARLAASLATRSAELAAIDTSMRRARANLVLHEKTVRDLVSAIKALLGAPPAAKWPYDTDLKALTTRLVTHTRGSHRSTRRREGMPRSS